MVLFCRPQSATSQPKPTFIKKASTGKSWLASNSHNFAWLTTPASFNTLSSARNDSIISLIASSFLSNRISFSPPHPRPIPLRHRFHLCPDFRRHPTVLHRARDAVAHIALAVGGQGHGQHVVVWGEFQRVWAVVQKRQVAGVHVGVANQHILAVHPHGDLGCSPPALEPIGSPVIAARRG